MERIVSWQTGGNGTSRDVPSARLETRTTSRRIHHATRGDTSSVRGRDNYVGVFITAIRLCSRSLTEERTSPLANKVDLPWNSRWPSFPRFRLRRWNEFPRKASKPTTYRFLIGIQRSRTNRVPGPFFFARRDANASSNSVLRSTVRKGAVECRSRPLAASAYTFETPTVSIYSTINRCRRERPSSTGNILLERIELTILFSRDRILFVLYSIRIVFYSYWNSSFGVSKYRDRNAIDRNVNL